MARYLTRVAEAGSRTGFYAQPAVVPGPELPKGLAAEPVGLAAEPIALIEENIDVSRPMPPPADAAPAEAAPQIAPKAPPRIETSPVETPPVETPLQAGSGEAEQTVAAPHVAPIPTQVADQPARQTTPAPAEPTIAQDAATQQVVEQHVPAQPVPMPVDEALVPGAMARPPDPERPETIPASTTESRLEPPPDGLADSLQHLVSRRARTRLPAAAAVPPALPRVPRALVPQDVANERTLRFLAPDVAVAAEWTAATNEHAVDTVVTVGANEVSTSQPGKAPAWSTLAPAPTPPPPTPPAQGSAAMGSRISIGRVDVQMQQAPPPVPPPRPRAPARSGIRDGLDARFLGRFALR